MNTYIRIGSGEEPVELNILTITTAEDIETVIEVFEFMPFSADHVFECFVMDDCSEAECDAWAGDLEDAEAMRSVTEKITKEQREKAFAFYNVDGATPDYEEYCKGQDNPFSCLRDDVWKHFMIIEIAPDGKTTTYPNGDKIDLSTGEWRKHNARR